VCVYKLMRSGLACVLVWVIKHVEGGGGTCKMCVCKGVKMCVRIYIGVEM